MKLLQLMSLELIQVFSIGHNKIRILFQFIFI